MSVTRKLKPIPSAGLMAVAACSMALSSASEIQLMPAGPFQAFDGRPGVLDGKPTGVTAWQFDESQAESLVAAMSSRATPYVIDYEHQTLRAAANGQPAPAAGWFNTVEWRPGVGLFAVDVQWTAAARSMIEAGEYKFISPVFAYDKKGTVTGLLMAAITNNPAILGMDEVEVAAATMHDASLTNTPPLNQEKHMEQIIEQLRWMLNLPVTSTPEEILAELNKLAEQIRQAQGGTAAASVDVVAMFGDMRQQIATLTAAVPDPSKFVPMDVLTAERTQVAALTSQVASLNAQIGANNLDTVIAGALSTGKLLPAQEAWARDLGGKNIAALTAFIESAPPLASLTGTQTGGKTPVPGAKGLTESQVALCTAMGLPQDQFLKTLQAETSA